MIMQAAAIPRLGRRLMLARRTFGRIQFSLVRLADGRDERHELRRVAGSTPAVAAADIGQDTNVVIGRR
jgi:hypothetical protein